MSQAVSTESNPLPVRYRNRPRWLRIAGWWAEAALVRAFWLLAGTMNADRAAAFGRHLFRWLGPKSRKQPFVERNLTLAFPELSHEQRSGLARKIWGNFGAVLAEYPHLGRFCPSDTGAAIELEVDPATRPILGTRQPAVYIAAHLGNWELAAAAITATGVPLSVVYAPQGNPLLDHLLQKMRVALGCKFVAKKNALRRLAREIRCGRSVGILPDQRVDSGEPVAFFGHAALTTTSPAWLALKMGCPLIPVQIVSISDGRYRAVFHPPLPTEYKVGTKIEVLRLTSEINRLFENWIRCEPGQWLCMRRRWPAENPNAGVRVRSNHADSSN